MKDMKTSTAPASAATPKAKIRPVTVGLPEPLYRRVRILCASRDQTLGSFFTALCEQATQDLSELGDLIGGESQADDEAA